MPFQLSWQINLSPIKIKRYFIPRLSSSTHSTTVIASYDCHDLYWWSVIKITSVGSWLWLTITDDYDWWLYRCLCPFQHTNHSELWSGWRSNQIKCQEIENHCQEHFMLMHRQLLGNRIIQQQQYFHKNLLILRTLYRKTR